MERIVGIIAAMEAEITAIKKEQSIEKKETVAGMEFCIGKLGGAKAVVVQCGMGKINAAIGTTILIEKYGANTIINVGCAGCLNDTLNIGDFVISEDVVTHDYDVSPIGFKKGGFPELEIMSLPADTALVEAARAAITEAAPKRKIAIGRICTGDQFICTEEQKHVIVKNFGGDCAEMEGSAVAQTAYMYGVPFVIIRAMSDKANGSGDFMAHFEDVCREGAEVVIAMAEKINS